MMLLSLLLVAQIAPPKNAIVLFDGKDTSAWQEMGSKNPIRWEIKDGTMTVTQGSEDIRTKQEFGDYKLHVEFWLPLMADAKSQGRANSGVYNQGLYEVQILDSYNNPTYKYGGCGALYAQKDPDKDAIKPPETWNTYDIDFRAPRFDAEGKMTERPRISVLHNGIKIHDNVEIINAVADAAKNGPIPKVGPIKLQNHGNPVRFRNIWIVPINSAKQ